MYATLWRHMPKEVFYKLDFIKRVKFMFQVDGKEVARDRDHPHFPFMTEF